MKKKRKGLNKAGIIAVYIPHDKRNMFDQLNKVIDDNILKVSRSELILQALDFFIGNDYTDIRDKIIDDYKSGVIDRSAFFNPVTKENFIDLFLKESVRTGYPALCQEWNISRWEMAKIAYNIALILCPE